MSRIRKEQLFLLRQTTLHRMVLQYDPQIGQRYVPNVRARIPFEQGGYYVRTNSEGFRSDIEFRRRRGGRPRILFFGDSFTAGFGVNNEQRFTDIIGHMLDAEVYNYGLTGSGTDQQLLVYERFAHDVEADLMVFCVMVENIERILSSHHRTIDRYSGNYIYVPKPYFQLENGRLQLYHSPVPITRKEETPEDLQTVERKVNSTRNRLLQSMRELYYHPKMSFLRKTRPVNILQNDVASKFLRVAQFQPYPDYLANDTPGWQLMAALLQRFIDQVTPTPVLIVPIPDSFFYRANALKPVYQERFAELADADRGVHVADVTSPINNLPVADRAKVPFAHDFHFSPYGNQRVAEFIADEILRRDLLPGIAGQQQSFSIGANGSVKKPDDAYILGISCFYHNAAACVIKNGAIVAAAEEERFTRIKHDRNFPNRAINYCLEEAGIQQTDLTAVVYYDNAYLTFERLLHTQLAIGEAGEEAWLRVLPSWLQYKLHIPELIRRYLQYEGLILQEVHHRSHAASAFYPSPYQRAAILTIDGVGEWATASISIGRDNQITMLKEMRFPHSVGLLYSAFTQFIGFKVNNGEYKMMGLAPYGQPKYVDLIYEHLVDLKEDGSIELNMEYFAFLAEPTMTNEKFATLFGGPARHPEEPVTQREMDIARSIQVVTEEIVMRMARHAYELTGEKYLCLAGGVALNCVANGRLLREGPFEDIWIQPAAGDAGCALGAALDVWHTYYGQPRTLSPDGRPLQRGSYWGPSYSTEEIKAFLDTFGYPYHSLGPDQRAQTVARLIEEGAVIGHFSDRLEYGPRALGSRSILGDARNQEMQTKINLKIKYRESFRPFAPSVLAEAVQTYFELDRESPYMLLVAPVQESRRLPFIRGEGQDLFAIVRQPRSDVPAITHVDYSARVQSVRQGDHSTYYDVIKAFQERTGCGVIVNTSFNVRGEPIVCSPYDAYRCFMRTEMDVLILGDYVLYKKEQPEWPEEKGHIEKYDPDAIPELDGEPALETLHTIFQDDFLPVAQQVQQSAAPRISLVSAHADSTWSAYPTGTPVQQVFTIPGALDNGRADPAAMVQAIMQYWREDTINQAFAPVLEKLLQVGCKQLALSADEEAVETVSDFVYVMY